MTLENIRQGILSNLAVRNRFTLEVDPVIEGNSYFGVCIFVGVALMHNFTIESIQEFLSEDKENILFMESKFLSIMDEYFNTKDPGDTAKGFHIKTSLILNYIKHNYGKTVSLAEIIKNQIK
tara:strand:- start:762 stop:1127 length:366 start_codon:yes stop_codon:yes gene_type:complete